MGQKTNPSALRLYLNLGKNRIKKKSPYGFGANFHGHNFSKKLHQHFQISNILSEIFNKSGLILADFKILQAQNQIQAFFSIYPRKNTAFFKFDSNQGSQTNKNFDKKRRLDWSSRELNWQELSLNFIENLSLFFESYFFNNPRTSINSLTSTDSKTFFKPQFKLLQADPLIADSLNLQLRNFKSHSFYADAIDILAILAKAKDNSGNAEMLAKFLSLELSTLNNPQILLDFLSNAFRILIAEAKTTQKPLYNYPKTPTNEERSKKAENFIESTKTQKTSQLLGIKIQIKGALAAFDRATSLKFQIGSLPFNKLKAEMDYSFQEVKAKRGLLSIKVWLHCSPKT